MGDDGEVERMRRSLRSERAALALRLTDDAIARVRAAIAREAPGLDERDRNIVFVRVLYGADLADRLDRWLTARSV